MLTNARQLHNLKDLRKYVNETLCESDRLVTDTFPVTERIVTRGGRPCGIFFCLHGPSSVKLTAIWETDTNTILFYGSSGERTHKTELESAPTLEPSSAQPLLKRTFELRLLEDDSNFVRLSYFFNERVRDGGMLGLTRSAAW